MSLYLSLLVWSAIIGILVFLVPYLVKKDPRTGLIAGFTTFVTVATFNLGIVYSNAIIYLNVDHPIFRISWADLFDGICVYAAVCAVLFFTLKKDEMYKIKHVGLIAFVITLFVDIFLF